MKRTHAITTLAALAVVAACSLFDAAASAEDAIKADHMKAEQMKGEHMKAERMKGEHMKAEQMKGERMKAERMKAEQMKGGATGGTQK